MSIIGIARQRTHVIDEIIMMRGGDADIGAEFVTLMRVMLGETFRGRTSVNRPIVWLKRTIDMRLRSYNYCIDSYGRRYGSEELGLPTRFSFTRRLWRRRNITWH
ncbi:hypothetical protein D3871_21275 [Noviherbaspirillum saxi]|uniref:Uncharacterized protein n=1 Tax=Noviherbaspirillum saxi TaxID=2320863 RepID=A0A3A3FK71_9BURK|nr:hypothetical protein D3871_21275 [Noviherbaspirillum saxi]